MPLDPSNIIPAELIRLLNSTPMGQVIDDRTLHKDRERAGYAIGKERTLNLVHYMAWLLKERAVPTATRIEPEEKESRPWQSKWDDSFFVAAFLFAKSGLSDSSIAAMLDVSPQSFHKWRKDRPALQDAIDRGRSKESKLSAGDFLEAIKPMLTEDALKCLNEIQGPNENDSAFERFEQAMDDNSKRVRQQMFLYSYVVGEFNVAHACREAGLGRHTITRWMKTDPGFVELMGGIDKAKKDFYESALMHKVANGDTTAIIHVNKTYNRDRGYGERLEIDVRSTVEHRHVIPLQRLNLEFDVMATLLEATRRYQEENPDDKSEWVDSTLKQLNGGE